MLCVGLTYLLMAGCRFVNVCMYSVYEQFNKTAKWSSSALFFSSSSAPHRRRPAGTLNVSAVSSRMYLLPTIRLLTAGRVPPLGGGRGASWQLGVDAWSLGPRGGARLQEKRRRAVRYLTRQSLPRAMSVTRWCVTRSELMTSGSDRAPRIFAPALRATGTGWFTDSFHP